MSRIFRYPAIAVDARDIYEKGKMQDGQGVCVDI